MADYVVSSIDFPRPEVVAAQADERALMRSEGWILPARFERIIVLKSVYI